ncbi:SCO family protein [Novispirillum itersonii]|uniref:SCO family protein n=1 Tax=Novispirillum itersonii TaxID=189 RepID=UPI00036A848E|nr:SCO family protein [Novispirillum itersonii]
MKPLQIILIVVAVAAVALGLRFAPGFLEKNEAVALGGPFTMAATTGQTVTQDSFKGKYMLMYFGYTYCPDVCPTGLTTLAQALNSLPADKADKIQPLFVTVDPARDTLEQMTAYVAAFHPRLIGLVGTAEQTAAIAKAYRVYYAKEKGKENNSDDYLVDHSAITYLMGPDGRFVSYFGHDTTAEEMAKKLASVL